jgi:hypothetical protein
VEISQVSESYFLILTKPELGCILGLFSQPHLVTLMEKEMADMLPRFCR